MTDSPFSDLFAADFLVVPFLVFGSAFFSVVGAADLLLREAAGAVFGAAFLAFSSFLGFTAGAFFFG